MNYLIIDHDSPSHDDASLMTLRECEDQTQRLVRELTVEESELFAYMVNIFYTSTAILRETKEEEPAKTAHSRLLAAASAPILSAMEPFLSSPIRDSQNQIILALLAYPTRFRNLRFNINIARGYMIERMLSNGNVWDRPHEELIWLGEHADKFIHVSGELQKRETVDRRIIEEMMTIESSLCAGSL